MTAAKTYKPFVDGAPLSVPLEQVLINRGGPGPIGVSRASPSTSGMPSPTPHSLPIRRLSITDIDCYDGDPRKFANEAYADIRQGILDGDYWGVLLVTRRPGSQRYMLAAGSNTTLRILKELYAETRDSRFGEVECREQPYRSEVRLLSQHLVENLNRGQMRFWEVATGMDELLAHLERERRDANPEAGDFTVREAASTLAANGLPADRSTVAVWRFAARRLHALGPALPALTARSVRTVLQPRILSLESLAKRFDLSQLDFDNAVLHPSLADFSRSNAQLDSSQHEGPDWDALCDAVEVNLARHLAEQPASLRSMLAALRLNSQATLSQLRMPSPNLVAEQRQPAETRSTASCLPGRQDAPSPADGGRKQSGTSRPPSETPQAKSLGAAVDRSNAAPSGPAGQGDHLLERIRIGARQLLGEDAVPESLCDAASMPLGFVIDPAALNSAATLTAQAARGPECHHDRALVATIISIVTGQNPPNARNQLDSDPSRALSQYLLARLDPSRSATIVILDEWIASVCNLLSRHPERWSQLRQLNNPS